jgi:hypothetical protein
MPLFLMCEVRIDTESRSIAGHARQLAMGMSLFDQITTPKHSHHSANPPHCYYGLSVILETVGAESSFPPLFNHPRFSVSGTK